MEILKVIERQVKENPILLYMKGSPDMPGCGFSARTVEVLMECGERFAYVNVLDNPELRGALPGYAAWPTFPQLWVEGELVGGCDIVTQMHDRGELQPLIEAAAKAWPARSEAAADEGSQGQTDAP